MYKPALLPKLCWHGPATTDYYPNDCQLTISQMFVDPLPVTSFGWDIPKTCDTFIPLYLEKVAWKAPHYIA